MNEEDIDAKFDFDPTDSMQFSFTTDISYKQIFLEVTRFIKNNSTNGNNNNINGRYLEYPKFYLNSKTPKCQSTKKCKKCDSGSNRINSKNGINSLFNLCLTKRREMANKLLDNGQEQECMTDSLSTTARQLYTSDKLLIKDSKDYRLNKNWFINVYSFLQWQKQVVNVLLQNLVQLNDITSVINSIGNRSVDVGDESVVYDEEKKIDCVTTSADSINASSNTIAIEESVFLYKFDLLTTLHSYLDQLIEYLVLYYSCFDTQSWIAVFYPFIEASIGTLHCNTLFAESRWHSKHVSSCCNELLKLYTTIPTATQNSGNKNQCLGEMRAISAFKRLLFDIYQSNSDDEHDNNNAFDLSHKIYIKLNETVNNIKSQLVIHEMTGHNVYEEIHHETNSTDESINEEAKDDWNVGEEDDAMKTEAPSFIRLFVIGRIIKNHLQTFYRLQHNAKIQKLANVFSKNPQTESKVVDIITRLTKVGIKKYMKKWYNEQKQANVIDLIFNEIILKQFETEYIELITYPCDGVSKSTIKIFNSRDLMCEIFQYLEYGRKFDGDMVSCSLVDSHWLYHVWNLNSVYFVDLTNLLNYMKYTPMNSSVITRILQRLIHAKHVFIAAPSSKADHMDHQAATIRQVLNKLIVFSHLKKVNVISFDREVDILFLKALMRNCCDRIEWFSVKIFRIVHITENDFQIISATAENQLSPLTFTNARHIKINDLYFYRTWTGKCQSLAVCLTNMTQTWCRYVVEHCDCSNILRLQLALVRNDDLPIKNLKSVLAKFASKFESMQQLELILQTRYDRCVFLVWQLLKPIIDKNNGTVQVVFANDHAHSFKKNEVDLLCETIEKEKLKVDTFSTTRKDDHGAITGCEIDGWVIGRLIEKGGFGDVYQAKSTENGSNTAMKFIARYTTADGTLNMRNRIILNEINALKAINHQNIIKLLHVHEWELKGCHFRTLVFVYMKNGNLYQYLRAHESFDLITSKRWFDQILNALCYLHNELNIAHRDLHPKNLLFDDSFNLKIADFSMCKFCDVDKDQLAKRESQEIFRHSQYGDGNSYIAPEMTFHGNSINYVTTTDEILACDIFSLGMILWKLLMGINTDPFAETWRRHSIKLSEQIDKCNDNDLKQLFTRMLDPFPKSRITTNEIKNDRWYNKIHGKSDNKHFIAKMSKIRTRKEILSRIRRGGTRYGNEVANNFDQIPLAYVLATRYGYDAFFQHCIEEITIENVFFLSEICYFKKRFLQRIEKCYVAKLHSSKGGVHKNQDIPESSSKNADLYHRFNVLEKDISDQYKQHIEFYQLKWTLRNSLTILTLKMKHGLENPSQSPDQQGKEPHKWHSKWFKTVKNNNAVGKAQTQTKQQEVNNKQNIPLYVLAYEIYLKYIREGSDWEVNISSKTGNLLHLFFQASNSLTSNATIGDNALGEENDSPHVNIDINGKISALYPLLTKRENPNLENSFRYLYKLYHIFDEAWAEIFHLFAIDVYQRFTKRDLFHNIKDRLRNDLNDEETCLKHLVEYECNQWFEAIKPRSLIMHFDRVPVTQLSYFDQTQLM